MKCDQCNEHVLDCQCTPEVQKQRRVATAQLEKKIIQKKLKSRLLTQMDKLFSTTPEKT